MSVLGANPTRHRRSTLVSGLQAKLQVAYLLNMAPHRTVLIFANIPRNNPAQNKDIERCLRELAKKEGTFDVVLMDGCIPDTQGKSDAESTEFLKGRAEGWLEGWLNRYGPALKASGTVVKCASSFFGGVETFLEDHIINVAESKGVVIDVIVIAFECNKVRRPGAGSSLGGVPGGMIGGRSGSGRAETILDRISRRAQCTVYNIYERTTKCVEYHGPRSQRILGEASDATSNGEVVNPASRSPVGQLPAPVPALPLSHSLPSGGPYGGASTPGPPPFGYDLVSPPAHGHSVPLYPHSLPLENVFPSPGGHSGSPGFPANHVHPHFHYPPNTQASAPPFSPTHHSTPPTYVHGQVYQEANGPFHVISPDSIRARPQVYMVDFPPGPGQLHSPRPIASPQVSGPLAGHSLGQHRASPQRAARLVGGPASTSDDLVFNVGAAPNGLAPTNVAQQTSASRHQGIVGRFTLDELKVATNNFSPAMMVGGGGYGSVYRGNFAGTEVAVKKLNPEGVQGPAEFKREIELLNTLRHPNIVTLMGCCPEEYCLVYEMCVQGSLKDRLADVTRPMPWYTRVQMLLQVATALLWMHKQGILHCDVKPANILVHANGTAKLGDVGIARVVPSFAETRTAALSCALTGSRTTSAVKGSFGYLDPALLDGYPFGPSSDVYALGVCTQQLLTNRDASVVKPEFRAACNARNMAEILDPTAGEWPLKSVVEDLTKLGLRCTHLDQDSRPDLETEILPVLARLAAVARDAEQHDQERMRRAAAEFAAMTAPAARPRDNRDLLESQAFCPVSLVMMESPVLAADGFTYEESFIRDWMRESRISPMTCKKFANMDLIPNLGVKSLIEELKERNRGHTMNL